ncbi:hypothetical protein, partial [Methylobacterium platani]
LVSWTVPEGDSSLHGDPLQVSMTLLLSAEFLITSLVSNVNPEPSQANESPIPEGEYQRS